MEKRTLFEIKTDEISPNPHNPRLFFEEEDLSELKKSIAKVGILVPLTVYENTKAFPKTKYILLDGERRWRCAQELAMARIPANIIDEPADVTQNILFMFNIHYYRKEWALFPTALKLEMLMKNLETDQESVLMQFTGVSRTTIRRCKKLLWYPEKYRDILMDPKGKISTDFFIELYPIAERLSNEEEFSMPQNLQIFVDAMISRFLEGRSITDVKEFIEIRKSMAFYESNNNFQEFKLLIEKFIASPDVNLEIFASPDAEIEVARKNILKYMGYLLVNLKEINPNLISDLYFVEQLNSLKETIENILEKID